MADRWIILLVLFLARTAMAWQFQTIGALGPVLLDAFQLDFVWLGALIGLYLLPGAAFALPGGLLAQRYGAKNVVLAGLLAMAIGGALTAADSFPLVAGGRLLSGMGAVAINVVMTRMVTDWFAGREIITAMSIFVASWPLGLALGLVAFPSLAAATSWSAVMAVAAAAALICLALVALVYRHVPGMPAGAGPAFQIGMTAREWLLISLGGLVWTTYNAGYIILISFLPEFFMARGYSLVEAGRLVSLLGWVLIPLIPLAGYAAERLDRPNLLMVGGFGIVALAAAALPFAAAPAAVFGVVVVGIGLPAGLIMALPAQALRPESRSVGMGVFYTFYYAGMALLPALAGLARDLTGSAAVTTLFAAAMMAIALLALVGFRIAQQAPRAS